MASSNYGIKQVGIVGGGQMGGGVAEVMAKAGLQTVIKEVNAELAEKILPNATPEEQYKFAVSFIKVGDYDTAELALR